MSHFFAVSPHFLAESEVLNAKKLLMCVHKTAGCASVRVKGDKNRADNKTT